MTSLTCLRYFFVGVVIASTRPTNSTEALQRARKRPPAIVLTDWSMPALDGVALLRAIRLDPAISETPVVFITSRTLPHDRETALNRGATLYLTKPTSLAFIGKQIEPLLH